eukprot:gene9225-12438_t
MRRIQHKVLIYRENLAGKFIDQDNSLYHTHQYFLFKIFYYRAKESIYRTVDPNEADIFFIPYDIGLDSCTRISDGALAKTNCPKINKIISLLESSTYFSRNYGHDHFLIHSINQMMLFYITKPCVELYKLCFNCTKFSIDSYPKGVYDYLDQNSFMTNKWISIPFPSDYHASSQNYQNRQNMLYSRKDRIYAVAFMGTIEVTAKLQKRLRIQLIESCMMFQDCLYVDLNTHESNANTNNIPLVSSMNNTKNQSLYHPYRYSQLCLMPGGDFPTRKGFLDALYRGCVPVTFQLISAQQQWVHHWGDEDTALSCSFYIPRENVFKNSSAVLEYLINQSKNEVVMKSKLDCINKIWYKMQYNAPNTHFKYASDAFDIAIQKI